MNSGPIGIIDSGFGGLAIAQAIWRRLPKESILYLADHQFFPYGQKSVIEINRRLVKLINFLLGKKVKLVVIACNTITMNSIDFLRRLFPIPFIGTAPAIKPAIVNNFKENIIVWATPATVKSHNFKKLISVLDKKRQVKTFGCPHLAQDIERLALQPEKLKQSIKKILAATPKPFSALVLGCTHYLLVKDLIASLLPLGVVLIDPSEAIAVQTERVLLKYRLDFYGSGERIFFTTGSNLNLKLLNLIASSLLKQSIIFKRCSI